MLKKINLKLFFPCSLLLTIGLGFFIDSWQGWVAHLALYVATLGWLFSLMLIVEQIISPKGERPRWANIFLILLFKLGLFGGMLFLGHALLGKKIFWALLNLPLQTSILTACAKKK